MFKYAAASKICLLDDLLGLPHPRIENLFEQPHAYTRPDIYYLKMNNRWRAMYVCLFVFCLLRHYVSPTSGASESSLDVDSVQQSCDTKRPWWCIFPSAMFKLWGSFPKISSDLSKSGLNETNKNVKKKVAKFKRERWLALFVFSSDLGTTGHPKVPCFVWWSKHSVDTKVARVRFVPTPHSRVSLKTSVWSLLGVEQISDNIQGLGFFGGVS